ncbi:MAG: hypothetical protein ABR964_01585 [Tepidisphaeraceae bacterium]|jgi:hypothetical protein
MYKSTILKWAVAALMAVPAVSTLAASGSAAKHRTLITRLHHKKVSAALSTHHRKLIHRHGKHAALSARRSLRHASASLRSGTVRPTVKITHIPPTIDGMHT